MDEHSWSNPDEHAPGHRMRNCSSAGKWPLQAITPHAISGVKQIGLLRSSVTSDIQLRPPSRREKGAFHRSVVTGMSVSRSVKAIKKRIASGAKCESWGCSFLAATTVDHLKAQAVTKVLHIRVLKQLQQWSPLRKHQILPVIQLYAKNFIAFNNSHIQAYFLIWK